MKAFELLKLIHHSMVEEDRQIIEAEDKSLMQPPRYGKNLDMKIEVRRELHYLYWLKGYKLREIEGLTGWERTTIWEDLNAVRAYLDQHPRNMEQIRQEALLSLKFLEQDVRQIIEEAKQIKPIRYDHIQRLIGEMRQINQTILERYTPSATVPELQARADEQTMAMIDYMSEKFGPEVLKDFQEWWKAKMSIKEALKQVS